MVFMGHGFTSGGQSRSLCLVQLCTEYRLYSKCHIELVPKDKRTSLKVKGQLNSCLLITRLVSRSSYIGCLIDICKPSIVEHICNQLLGICHVQFNYEAYVQHSLHYSRHPQIPDYRDTLFTNTHFTHLCPERVLCGYTTQQMK